MNWLERRKTLFERQRLKALRAIDTSENWLEARAIITAYFRGNNVIVPDSDNAILAAVHNERLRTSGITIEERTESRDWLRNRGFEI